MKALAFALLILACVAQRAIVTKEYADYLRKHVSWEVQDYEDNIFKGWTDEEFKTLLGENEEITEEVAHDDVQPDISGMPKSLDWSGANCIHEIANQGNCGSCWAFSVTSVVSDRCCLRGKDYGWLAPQELVSCDKSNSGCNGGDRTAAMRFVEKNGGIVNEACFPYLARMAICPTKCADGKDWKSSHVCKCSNVKQCSGASGMIACLASGPVAVGMAVYEDFMHYKSGVYKWDKKSVLKGYHAIRLVGYGEDFWKCANSWGKTWGMEGYFMIGKGECGLESRNPVICDPIA